MAKDPAFLFYTSDFLTGTMLMDDEQVGKYIRLLCLQHQKSTLTEKDMLKICGSYDSDIWAKFESDDSGNFWNARLKLEADKRNAFAESRRQNRLKKNETSEEHMNNISKTYVPHMENENEDINDNIIDIESINKVLPKNKKLVQTSEASERFMKWYLDTFDTKGIKWTDSALNKAKQSFDKSVKRLREMEGNEGLSDDSIHKQLAAIIKWIKADDFWSGVMISPSKLMDKDKNGLLWLDIFVQKYRMKSPEIKQQATIDEVGRNVAEWIKGKEERERAEKEKIY